MKTFNHAFCKKKRAMGFPDIFLSLLLSPHIFCKKLLPNLIEFFSVFFLLTSSIISGDKILHEIASNISCIPSPLAALVC